MLPGHGYGLLQHHHGDAPHMMNAVENHSSHGYTTTHCQCNYEHISGFIQLEKRNRQLFFHSFPLLVFITIWSLVISSCIHFCFSFSSVCSGGQEKRRHGRCMPDSLLDNFVLLLSLGHADITCSPAVHAHYPPAPMSLCLDSNHPSPHLPYTLRSLETVLPLHHQVLSSSRIVSLNVEVWCEALTTDCQAPSRGYSVAPFITELINIVV